MTATTSYTSFEGSKRIASGSLQTNALTVKRALAAKHHGTLLTFSDQTGDTVEIDLRCTDADILSRLSSLMPSAPARHS